SDKRFPGGVYTLSTCDPHDLMKESRVPSATMVGLLFFLLRLLLSPVRPISRLEPRTRRTVPRAIIDLKARTGVRAIRIPGPFVSLRSNDVPQRLWKAPMPSSTLLAARVRSLAMVRAVGLASAPSPAGDDRR